MQDRVLKRAPNRANRKTPAACGNRFFAPGNRGIFPERLPQTGQKPGYRRKTRPDSTGKIAISKRGRAAHGMTSIGGDMAGGTSGGTSGSMGANKARLTARPAKTVKEPAIPVSCLGIGLISALTELSYINPPYYAYSDPTVLFALFDAATVLLAAIIALRTRRAEAPRTLVSRSRNLAACCGALVLSICLNFCAQMVGLSGLVVYALAAVVGGLGIALPFVMWFEVVSHLSPVQLLMCYALAAIGRVGVIWLCGGMAIDRVWASLCGAAVAAVALLARARDTVWQAAGTIDGLAREPGDASRPGLGTADSGTKAAEGPQEKLCRFPLKPLMVVITGTLLLSFVLHSIGNAWGTNGNPGVVAASAGTSLILAVKGEAFEFKRLWQASLAFMVASVSLFVLLRGTAALLTAGMFACMAYELCLMLTYSILGNLVFRNFYNSTFLYAVQLAVALTSGHLGNGLATWLSAGATADPSPAFVAVACALGVAFAAVCMGTFSKKSLRDTWGVIVTTPMSQDFDLLLEKTRLGLRCHELAQEADLSRREEEVLLLLAQKKKPAAIAEQLGIEPSTVTTHRKHVYQKLGVHSAKQLQGRIGSAERTEEVGSGVRASADTREEGTNEQDESALG